eukprot:TRINITY_DN23318_c0_g1_i1.p1 TRINITY_DN23318_c0_g1~~TRINITY_DN23318_c0_g1_i1.p1  ORF type:complete len:1004 (-),score=156.38 TRINITY_DN23318_c0_g1_i1:63-3074(-)
MRPSSPNSMDGVVPITLVVPSPPAESPGPESESQSARSVESLSSSNSGGESGSAQAFRAQISGDSSVAQPERPVAELLPGSVPVTRRESSADDLLKRRPSAKAAKTPSLKEFSEARKRQSFANVARKASDAAFMASCEGMDAAARRQSVRMLSEPGRQSVANLDILHQLQELEEMKRKRRFRWITELRAKAVPYSRFINKTKTFQTSMFLALLFALFLPDLWILFDRPNNDDLDVILTLVLVAFIVEFAVQCTALGPKYIGTFFFYMDMLGACSLLLDLSFLGILSGSDEGGSNVIVMRAARIAKLGARAGRFTKLVKLLRFLPGMDGYGSDAGTAKVLSARLNQALSTRVSVLIITMVLITPLFSLFTFPVQDASMKSWLRWLSDLSADRPQDLSREIDKFEDFYKDLTYYPYLCEASSSLQQQLSNLNPSVTIFPWSSTREHPTRQDSYQTHSSEGLTCRFNFRGPNQMESGMNLLLLVFIMVLMTSFSVVLQASTSRIVLRPLEKLLHSVRQTAATIFQSVTDMTKADTDKEDDQDSENEKKEAGFGSETALLDKVVQKLSAMQASSSNDDDTDTGGWNQSARRGKSEAVSAAFAKRDKAGKKRRGSAVSEEDEDSQEFARIQLDLVLESGLTMDLLESWNLNPLELDKTRNKAATVFFVGPQTHGLRCERTSRAFMDAAEAGHIRSNPYHNWFHAVDVSHTVWRVSRLCKLSAIVSGHEYLALIVSAVCHDLGHMGLGNTFLMETSHPLAMMYNDKSPLENMSCAKLFAILAMQGCAIFECLTVEQYREARKTCIEAILHTDNAQHFSLVKEVQMFYEVNSEVLDTSRAVFHDMQGDSPDDDDAFPTVEAEEVFKDDANRRLVTNLLLHIADVSNSTKPFRICRTWAYKLMEEFFRQGDEELKLGIPVQALNNRNIVNKPFCQVGFIEYLVSPLLFTSVKILPPTESLLEQMMLNVKSWQAQWLSETPEATDSEKKALQDRVQKLHLRFKALNDSQVGR